MEESRKKLVQYWLKAASRDWEVVNTLFENGHYPYALYFGHLVLERVLKGYYVKAVGKQAPYTHRLAYLVEKSALKLSPEQENLLEVVDRFNIAGRYPDEKFEFYKICTQEYASEYLKKIKEFYRWMLKKF